MRVYQNYLLQNFTATNIWICIYKNHFTIWKTCCWYTSY